MASTAAESTLSDVPPPGSRHTDAELTKAIDHAKDQFGVISPSGAQDELASMNAADWKRLSQMYPQNNTIADGFYISDDSNGVEIHNDLSAAKTASTSTYTQRLEQNAKEDWSHLAKATGMLTGISAGVGGLVAGDMAFTLGEGATIVGASTGVGLALGASVCGGILAYQAFADKSDAKQDLSQGTVKLSPAVWEQ